jgi:hypothetical protein
VVRRIRALIPTIVVRRIRALIPTIVVRRIRALIPTIVVRRIRVITPTTVLTLIVIRMIVNPPLQTALRPLQTPLRQALILTTVTRPLLSLSFLRPVTLKNIVL